MSPVAHDCRLTEGRIRGLRSLTLDNGLISVTVLPEKGADIYSFMCLRTGVDVLWKSPWGLQRTPAETEAQWLDQYEGGWQLLFPNAGEACEYKGALLPFHGEACLREWDAYEIRRNSAAVCLELRVELCRSPFALRRTLRLEKGKSALFMNERIENRSEAAMPYLWGHHPAFGAPLVAGGCRILAPAREYLAHEPEISPRCRIPAGRRGRWPVMAGKDGSLVDLGVIPSWDQPVSEFGYLCGLEGAWYVIENRTLDLSFGLAWEKPVFPYLWFWLESGGCLTPPWYGRCRVLALEPFCAIPATGLANALRRGEVPWLQAKGSIETNLTAVCFSPAAVSAIDLDGTPRP